MTDIVQKLWGFCHTLRHDGIDYGDYIEQITYLLFLKMADERGVALPADADWPTLRAKAGTDLTEHFQDTLRVLGRQPGLLGDIFAGAQSRFSNPVNLKRLVNLIDETEWIALDVDVKAEAFEGLLEKAASEGKKGAGQYFTPRLLIKAIVRCMKPDPREASEFRIMDPACGTGGFLVVAYEWLKEQTEGGALPREIADRVLDNDAEKRAEGKLLRLQRAEGPHDRTKAGMLRYDVHIDKLVRVPFRPAPEISSSQKAARYRGIQIVD